jgi:hypothetical protein
MTTNPQWSKVSRLDGNPNWQPFAFSFDIHARPIHPLPRVREQIGSNVRDFARSLSDRICGNHSI